MSDSLSDSLSSYAGYGTNSQSQVDSARSLYSLAVAPQSAMQSVAQSEENMAPQLSNYPVEEASLVPDRTVAEVAIRRLSKEMEHAKEELHELEKNLTHEMLTPSVRAWLLPLMAVGLVLSLYGSIASSNTAELGATGLMLLWSLAAFWFVYTRERKVEATAEANRAELEIWSSRITELEQALAYHLQMVDTANK